MEKRLSYLLEQYKTGQCTVAERQEFLYLVNLPENEAWLKTKIDIEVHHVEALTEPYALMLPQDVDYHLLTTVLHQEQSRKQKRHFIRRYWAAAVLLLAIGTSIYYWQQDVKTSGVTTPLAQLTIPLDITPGRQGAILTLGDGSQVLLDSLNDGAITQQNGTQVVLENGELMYNPASTVPTDVAYNTMTTPSGRQFQLTLPDGTKVWLNAASSIQYPTAFIGKTRNITITGEVYLEVAQNIRMPFFVNINNKAEVQVLGTSFNINAYNNEAGIYTTLVEGAVRVVPLLFEANKKNSSSTLDINSVILQPGQQAQILQTNQKESPAITIIENVATDKVLAWKEGFFNFEGLTFEQVMRQLERWYDIEVKYENGIPHKKLIGKMTKDVSLNGLLIGLKELGIHCRLEARKLIILP